ncbi:MAG TPA: hypothetical protein DC046_16815 [Rhodospirillaceae bacterium]|nr:hypothetical protein [Rhodospirillaceae bacterium]
MGGYGRSFLTASVGRGQENRADDVHTVSTFLAENKLMPAATRDADEDFLSAIEKGQIKLNELAGDGLRVDGIVKPWGPTEVLSQRAVTSGRMRASENANSPYPWFSGESPETSRTEDGTIDKLLQKFNYWLYQQRGERIPFMGKTPVGGRRG